MAQIINREEFDEVLDAINQIKSAQAERMTVNHDVAGSSPAGGAKRRLENITFSSLLFRFQPFFLS